MNGLTARAVMAGLLLLLGGVPAAAQEYTLEDLYRIGMQKSEKIRISGENVEIADSGKYRALSALLPRATAFGTYTNYTDEKRNATNSLIQPDRQSVWGRGSTRTCRSAAGSSPPTRSRRTTWRKAATISGATGRNSSCPCPWPTSSS